MDRRKYPIRVEDYELYETVGDGSSAAVHRARCIPFDEIVAIKILDFERSSGNLNSIAREAQTMALVDHPNLLNAHCSFVNDHNLWVVMPYMSGGSCFHIMKSAYPKGFEEVVIATILREVLKGLAYLHVQGHIHRDVKAGNILVDAHGGVKLGDFGVSACLFDSGDRQRNRNTFVGTPCWMAPEVMEQIHGYDVKADIWSFGITALELAHGHAPFSSHSPMKLFAPREQIYDAIFTKRGLSLNCCVHDGQSEELSGKVLLMTLQNAPPSLDSKGDKKFSRSFKQMIAMCLMKDPSKRPSAEKLLHKTFFKQARSQDYIARKVLEGLPPLGIRFQALKQKEEELLKEKKMLYGEKEEISQNEYKRGISGWNFDIEDLKAQASLVSDHEDNLSGKDLEGCSKPLFELDTLHENCPVKENGSVEILGMMQKKSPFLSSPDQTATHHRARSDVAKSESEIAWSNDILQHGSEFNGTNMYHLSSSIKQNNQLEKMGNCISQPVTELPSEGISKAPESAVVQQRGRFKVTSEDTHLDKVLPVRSLSRSHSLQVVSSPRSNTATILTSEMSNQYRISLVQLLTYILQSNIQKDNILSLMKQVSHIDLSGHPPTEGQIVPTSTSATATDSPRATREKARELIRAIDDLQTRLASAKEELQKLAAGDAQEPRVENGFQGHHNQKV